MRVRILTLRYCARRGRFDDGPLVALQQRVVLDDLREHLVHVGADPILLCVARWRDSSHVLDESRDHQEMTSSGPYPGSGAPDSPSPRAKPRTSPTGEDRPAAVPVEAQRAQFERIRAWRAKTAHDEGVPPYVILTNRQLVEVVKQRPDSRTALGRIDGLGDKKLDRYAKALLAQLRPDPTAPTDAGETDTETAQPEEETTS